MDDSSARRYVNTGRNRLSYSSRNMARNDFRSKLFSAQQNFQRIRAFRSPILPAFRVGVLLLHPWRGKHEERGKRSILGRACENAVRDSDASIEETRSIAFLFSL